MNISIALPSEIWQEITELACTDGGRTGASLAQSCKFLRVQSYAKRFHSLAFHTLAQLESFLSLIRAFPSPHVDPTESESQGIQIPVVRHLWLSFPDESSSAVPAPKLEWDYRALTALRALLPLIAPTLFTLVVAQETTRKLPPLALAFAFPRLTELTLNGAPTNNTVGDDPASTTHCPFDLTLCPFPALRRLHILSNNYGHKSAQCAFVSSPTLRALTHLRLSALADGCITLPAATLARVLGVSKITDRDDPPPPTTLRHLIIHTIESLPEPPECGDSPDGSWDEEVDSDSLYPVTWAWALHHAGVREADGPSSRSETESTDPRHVVYLRRAWRHNFKWKARMWDDWVARMEGGRGCWVEDEDEEAAREGPRAPEDDYNKYCFYYGN